MKRPFLAVPLAASITLSLTLGCGDANVDRVDIFETSDTLPPDDIAGEVVGDVAADTALNDTAPGEVDTGRVDGPGLGIDYGATAPGAKPRFDLAAEGWMSVGWPSDRYRENGHVRLSNMPMGVAGLLDDYITFGEEVLDGFGLNGTVYFGFDADLEEAVLPSPEASMRPDAAVQMVNVSPGPHEGTRLPLVFKFYGGNSDPIYEPRTLALRPVYGFPLEEGDTYCAIVTRAVKDAAGNYLQQPEGFTEALDREPYFALLKNHLFVSPLAREDVATATCFTAQHATDELVRVSRYIDDAVPPEVETVFEPGVWGEFHGIYVAPNFQSGVKPYQEDGDIRFDERGQPVPQADESLRFMLLTPSDHAMPEAGWPIVLYAHGTGGDYESCRGDTKELVLDGLAVLCVDQPLHGPRGPGRVLTDAELVLFSFNFVNPHAGRSAFRQAAIDTLWLSRMIEAHRFDLEANMTKSGKPMRLDPDNIHFFGHSHGGLSGTLTLAVDPRIKSGVISGMAGVIIETILRRKDPADLAVLTATLLGIDPNDLDTFHPALNLMQMLVDATDPVNYTRLWLRPPAGVRAKHVFVTEGTEDHASPSVGTDASTAAGLVPQVLPVAKTSEAHVLRGLAPVSMPVRDNVTLPDGQTRTVGLRQWQGGEHWVAFDAPDGRAMWRHFLVSAANEESPELSTGDLAVAEAGPVSPADRCEDAREIPTVQGFPATIRGNTQVAGADYTTTCPSPQGAPGRDLFYRFTPPASGTYRFRIALEAPINRDTPRRGPDLVTVLSSCGGECLGSKADGSLDLSLESGKTVYIAVDGTTVADVGSYALVIEQRCAVVECGERECGNYGCGSCGQCGAGEYCTSEGRCEPTLPGESCAAPIEGSTLPWSWSGDTRAYANDGGYGIGSCPGFPFYLGHGSDDVVFRYVPPESGKLVATIDGDYDVNLWASDVCGDASTCLGANRTAGRSARILLDGVAGEPIFIFADGASNSGNSAGHVTVAVEACVPRCDGRACGDDGCGGSCGACGAGENCVESAGNCPIPYDCPKVTECRMIEGDICEAAFRIDSVPFMDARSTEGFTQDYGVGGDWCPAMKDGSGITESWGFGAADVAYAFTAPKSGLFKVWLDTGWPTVFDASLYLARDCGDIEATCIAADERDRNERVFARLNEGETVYAIVDGWTNFWGQTGSYELHVDECLPTCVNRQCGSDGCDGSCGTCGAGLTCQGSRCLAPQGQLCTNPRWVGELPWRETLDTTNYGADRQNGCAGAAASALSPEVTYRFKAPADGSYRVTLTASFEAQLYVDGACASNLCLGSGPEVELALVKDQSIYITVDGVDGAAGPSMGAFTLDVRPSCTPQCDGKSCGDDGCGGSCGTCAFPADICMGGGTCVDPTARAGNTCVVPLTVGDLPFEGTGDTAAAGVTNDYVVDEGQCGGFVAKGLGSNDEVWSFTAPAEGAYVVQVLTSGWDAFIVALGDCEDPVGTCLAANDSQEADFVTLTLSAGDRVYLIVDGEDNVRNDKGAYTLRVFSR
jgi:hypothetical protein